MCGKGRVVVTWEGESDWYVGRRRVIVTWEGESDCYVGREE